MALLPTPRRISLVAETEACLSQGIRGARWKFELPGIRRLSEELHVSGCTLRSALRSLANKGLIDIQHGRPCRINSGAAKRLPPCRGWSIGYIDSVTVPQNRTWHWMWFNEFRLGVQKAGGEIIEYHLPGLYRARISTLARLVRQNPHDCWIIGRGTRQMQAWFEQSQIPAIAAGTVWEDVRLPSIDLDYRALGRHAAGRIRAFGHRRIAFVASRLRPTEYPAAGVMELERGLREVCQRGPDAGEVELIPIYHNFGDKADTAHAFAQLIALSPTVAVISHPHTFYTGMSFLAQQGVVVPRDLSVVVAEDDQNFTHWVPELTRYEASIFTMAQQMLRLLRNARTQTLSPDDRVRITPRFVAGKTLVRHGVRGQMPPV